MPSVDRYTHYEVCFFFFPLLSTGIERERLETVLLDRQTDRQTDRQRQSYTGSQEEREREKRERERERELHPCGLSTTTTISPHIQCLKEKISKSIDHQQQQQQQR